MKKNANILAYYKKKVFLCPIFYFQVKWLKVKFKVNTNECIFLQLR